MTKWNLPEGRMPLTDADLAALTRRLADTAIEHSELYQAAKRDAEEAEAYVTSLESDMDALTDMLRKSKERNDALESKLTMSDLMDRFKAAADALADAVTHEREMVCQDIAMQIAASDAVEAALTEYRAAREAITRGTPPAPEDQPND
jgi:chromosome segregation ATPase